MIMGFMFILAPAAAISMFTMAIIECIARRLGLVLPVLVFRDGDRPCRFCDVYYDEGVPEVSLYVGRHDVFSRRVGVELPPARFYLSVLPPVGGSDFTTFGGYEIPKVD